MSTAPDWSRLSIVPVSPAQALVVDRGNGRWVYLPAGDTPLVQLLNVPAARLPGAVRERRDLLAGELIGRELGRRYAHSPSDLDTLILKLTKACNYACSYCYDFEPDDVIQHIPFESAREALREGLELCPEQLTVIMHGGEPLLVWGLIKRLVLEGEALAQQMTKRIRFVGQTNLSRLTADVVEFSEAHDIGWGVSLDGPPEINDRYRVLRSGKGTYERYLKARAEFPEFVAKRGIMSTVTALNDARLLEVARHFRDLGVRSWNWSLFEPIGQARAQAALMDFSIERLLVSWNQLFDAIVAGEFEGMQVGPVVQYLANFLNGPGQNMCLRRECGAGRDLLSISSDGRIEACDCIDPQGPYADLGLIQIGKRSLTEARSSGRAELIRSRDVALGDCNNCPWLTLCGGTCLAHVQQIHGKWAAQCHISMTAFTRIAASLAESDALLRYVRSLQPAAVEQHPQRTPNVAPGREC